MWSPTNSAVDCLAYRGHQHSIAEIEQLSEEGRLPFLVARVVLRVPRAVPLLGLVVRRGIVGPRSRLRLRRKKGGPLRSRRGPLDDLVELATVQPNSPAFRAIVNLDALTLGHD